jgi:hypothetical protein
MHGPARKWAVLLAALAVTGAIAGVSSATRGGKNAVPAVTTASIVLNQVDTHYGDAVTFTVAYPEMRETALVWLSCFRDGQQIHQFGGLPSETFGLWNANPWTGGPADCRADLYYFTYKGQVETSRVFLANTTFHVGS